jgi:hypothetical protein
VTREWTVERLVRSTGLWVPVVAYRQERTARTCRDALQGLTGGSYRVTWRQR